MFDVFLGCEIRTVDPMHGTHLAVRMHFVQLFRRTDPPGGTNIAASDFQRAFGQSSAPWDQDYELSGWSFDARTSPDTLIWRLPGCEIRTGLFDAFRTHMAVRVFRAHTFPHFQRESA